jgi:hypothetical protein
LSTDVEQVQRELQLDREGRIAEDLPCRACGYNVRGVAPEALCPECSTPVSRSIRSDLLQFGDPAWVERLARGMRWIIIGLLCGFVVQIAVAVLSTGLVTAGSLVHTAGMTAAALFGVGLSVVLVTGVWWLTAPDPARAERERPLSARRLTRWCIAAQIAAVPLQVASPTGSVGIPGSGAPPGGAFIALAVVGSALGIVVLVGYAAGFVYLGRLALRIPQPPLARQTRIVRWGYLISQSLAALIAVLFLFVFVRMFGAGSPGGTGQTAVAVALAIGGCAITIGSLVFGIWALVLLFKYAAAFREAASTAQESWDRP